MAKTLFLIFNHTITPPQESDARRSLGILRIIDLPLDLKNLWRSVPPDLSEIIAYLYPLKTWLKSNAEKDDYALIQGDFGACYIMVNFAFDLEIIPIYSTTEREAIEEHERNGTVKLTHEFKHQGFRRYGV
jgi:hypothetical protein